MGKHVSFSVEAKSAASPAAVYALLSDGATWPTWSPFQAFELEREGEAGGESKGAIRVLTSGRIRNREELTELSPDRLFGYSSLSGFPSGTIRRAYAWSPWRTGRLSPGRSGSRQPGREAPGISPGRCVSSFRPVRTVSPSTRPGPGQAPEFSRCSAADAAR